MKKERRALLREKMKPAVPGHGGPAMRLSRFRPSHLLDGLPVNLPPLSPEHFYCSAPRTGRRYLRSTMLLCCYQLFNTLSCWNPELWKVISASFHGGLTPQDGTFDLPPPLPSPSLKSQHATEIKADQLRFILLFIKQKFYQQPKGKGSQEGQKQHFHKSCSSGEHIWKQISKKAVLVGQFCIHPSSRLMITHRGSNLKSSQDDVWCQTLTTTDLLITPKLPAHVTLSEYSLFCINIILPLHKNTKLRFPASCTCLKT